MRTFKRDQLVLYPADVRGTIETSWEHADGAYDVVSMNVTGRSTSRTNAEGKGGRGDGPSPGCLLRLCVWKLPAPSLTSSQACMFHAQNLLFFYSGARTGAMLKTAMYPSRYAMWEVSRQAQRA